MLTRKLPKDGCFLAAAMAQVNGIESDMQVQEPRVSFQRSSLAFDDKLIGFPGSVLALELLCACYFSMHDQGSLKT
jgi:hypothetical protein